jgi:predicted nuclease with TOPRIM domain
VSRYLDQLAIPSAKSLLEVSRTNRQESVKALEDRIKELETENAMLRLDRRELKESAETVAFRSSNLYAPAMRRYDALQSEAHNLSSDVNELCLVIDASQERWTKYLREKGL